MISMMQKTVDDSLSAAARQRASECVNEPAWLAAIHHAALLRFEALGLPTTDHEDWRFTSVEAIGRTAFAAPADRRDCITPADVKRLLFPDLAGARLVFVDGRWAPHLSDFADLPPNVAVVSLAQALAQRPQFLERHLARYADIERDAFTALNTAMLEEGAFVHVPRGVVLTQPIHLLYLATPQAQPTATHPRNLIVVEESAQAAVVEDYATLGGSAGRLADSPSRGLDLPSRRSVSCFTNSVTEVVVGDNATVEHYLIEREDDAALTVQTLRVQQGRDSDFTSHTVLMGGALVRNNVHPVLNGQGAHCLLNGLFIGAGRQHLDNFMRVEHAQPHCDSRQFYKGILADESHGVFSGRIVVHPGAQKTDAKQTNMNLLLSESAQIDTKPQLEIYADDVKCTHGATIGQIDEDAIFYLRSRGIPGDAAKALLIFAFANESLNRMNVEAVRTALSQELARRLEGSGVKAEV